MTRWRILVSALVISAGALCLDFYSSVPSGASPVIHAGPVLKFGNPTLNNVNSDSVSGGYGFDSVSCPSVSGCVAVGGGLNGQYFLDTFSHGAWGKVTFAPFGLHVSGPTGPSGASVFTGLPSHNHTAKNVATRLVQPQAQSLDDGGLNGVSVAIRCFSLISCDLVVDNAIAQEVNGSWLPWHKYGSPNDVSFSDISCRSKLSCVAVGRDDVQNANLPGDPIYVIENHGHWGKLQFLTGVPMATLDLADGLQSVSCYSSDACTGIGAVSGESGEKIYQANLTAGTMRFVSFVPISNNILDKQNSGGSGSPALTGLHCAGPTTCVATGSYRGDFQGHDYGLVASEIRGIWKVSAMGKSGSTGLSCINSKICIGSTESNYFLLYNGASWRKIPSFMSGGSTWMSAISCWTNGGCLATGSFNSAPYGQQNGDINAYVQISLK
jgi:hypothetical protein